MFVLLAVLGLQVFRSHEDYVSRRELVSMWKKFDADLKVAQSTPRMALAPQVAALSNTRHMLSELHIPSACILKNRKVILEYMDMHINSLLEFLSSRSTGYDVEWRGMRKLMELDFQSCDPPWLSKFIKWS